MERRKLVESMLADNPKDDLLQYMFALELKKLGEQNEAKSILHKLLEHNADYLPAYYQLVEILISTKEFDQAFTWVNKAISIAEKLKEGKTKSELEQLKTIIEDEQ